MTRDLILTSKAQCGRFGVALLAACDIRVVDIYRGYSARQDFRVVRITGSDEDVAGLIRAVRPFRDSAPPKARL